MESETILIVEDDPSMLKVLRDNLEFSGFSVLTAVDGREGLHMARTNDLDLIILDIMLPEVNGYELCRLIRKDGLDMPIIMLTAKGQESDIILGLNLGADDYVTKPFSIKELVARAEAFLRRRRQNDRNFQQFGQCELDINSRQLRRDGHDVALTPKEFDLLAFFARNRGRAVTREEILRTIWDSEVLVTARSVDRCVNTLRGKVEVDPSRPALIRTIHRIGYRFDTSEEN